MSEQVNTEVPVKVETEISTSTEMSNNLIDSLLNDTMVTREPLQNQTTTESTVTNETKPAETENTEQLPLNTAAYLKEKFGWDSEEVALNEVKALREKSTQTFEYKNEESKKIAAYINEGKIDDLYSFLDMQKKVEKLSTADVSDKNTASELVKFGIQKDNPNLSSDDVDFLFSKKFSVPKEPVQRADELDEDFAERQSTWAENKNDIERQLIIEAKMAQPKMAQLKTELVLPDIQKQNQEAGSQISQEDLDFYDKQKEAVLQSIPQAVGSFNGFAVQVKDKDVDYTTSYTPSKEDKEFISGKIKAFAESGFNSNVLFLEKWVNEDRTINVNQMTEDLSRVYFGKNSDQKLAIDSANKRIEAYIKGKKNINVNETNENGNFNPANKSGQEVLVDAWMNV